ncbi:MAG: thioredoxin family protein, partial [Odoribacter splanchnicus]
TSWCGPCKMLAKEVFTDPEVAAFFNEKFVNVKVDMEKGEGMELKEQYKVSAYPTLNFIDGNGGLQHCVVGGMPADALIAQAKLALEGKGLIALQTLYVQGNRESQFIEDYLTALDMGNQAAEAEKVALDYLGKIERAQLKEKANWDMFNKYINDVDSDIFRYVYDNRNEFAGLFGEKEVKAKIRKVWTLGANRYVTGEGEEVVYDQKGFKKYVKRLSKADVDGKTDIIENARMTNAEKLGDWKTYIALGSEQLKNGKVGDLVLYNWGLRINRGCKDSALRMQAAQWFDDAAAKSKEGPMSFKVYFERVANDLKQDYKESK